jgi:hypothetical protein
VCGSLDLEDLLFLGPTDAIDVVDVTVGRLLDDLQELVDLVRPEVAFALELLEVIGSVATEIADLDPPPSACGRPGRGRVAAPR